MKAILGIHLMIVVTVVTSQDAENPQQNTNDDEVVVHFLDYKRDELLEILPKLKATLGSLLDTYCKSNACTLISRQNYSADSIEFVGATDKERFVESNRYLITTLRAFCVDDASEKIYLARSILEDFIIKSRNHIASASQVEIAFLNSKFIYPARSNLENYIIIPISVFLVVAIVVVNFICQRKRDTQVMKKPSKTPIYKKKANDEEPEKFPLTTKIYEKQKMLTQNTNIPTPNINRPAIRFTEV